MSYDDSITGSAASNGGQRPAWLRRVEIRANLRLRPVKLKSGYLLGWKIKGKCPLCVAAEEDCPSPFPEEIRRGSALILSNGSYVCEGLTCPAGACQTGTDARNKAVGLLPQEWVELLDLEWPLSGWDGPGPAAAAGSVEGPSAPARSKTDAANKPEAGGPAGDGAVPTDDAPLPASAPRQEGRPASAVSLAAAPHLTLVPPDADATTLPAALTAEAAEALAADGLGLLAGLLKTVRGSTDKQERVAAVASVLGDNDAMLRVGAAYRLHSGKVTAKLQQIRAIRGFAEAAKDLKREAKRRAGQIKVVGPEGESPKAPKGAVGAETVASWSPDAPLAHALVVPDGYLIGDRGVFRQTGSPDDPTWALVMSEPVLIVGRMEDVHDGTVDLVVAWQRKGAWKRRVVPRERLANRQTIISEARHDLPITSINALPTVAFLAAFEDQNLDVLPTARVSRSMGWVGDGHDGFLWGRKLIKFTDDLDAVDGSALALDSVDPEDWDQDWIAFHADEEDGGAQLADGFRAAGTLDAWRSAIDQCAQFPAVMLQVYGAFVPPLLPLIPEVPNFCLDLSGTTSRGKTTAMKVSASVWGCPEERAGGVLHTWDMTRVAIERTAAVQGHMPLYLDDTKRARYPRMVAQVVYDLASGKGRGRGSISGLRRSTACRTILFSTGESPLTSATEDGGSRARVVGLAGPPFGGADETTAKLAVELRREVGENYGHAGPAFVRKLHEKRERWSDYPVAYKAVKAGWDGLAGGHPVASRMAAYFAALELAGLLAARVGLVPAGVRETLLEVWKRVIPDMTDADPPERALRQVWAWAGSHAAEFWGRHEVVETQDGSYDRVPSRGWAGAWASGPDWPHVAFVPTVLRKVLTTLGHEPEGIIGAWAERGWLATDKDRRTKRVHVYKGRQRCVCLRREVLVEIGEADAVQQEAAVGLGCHEQGPEVP